MITTEMDMHNIANVNHRWGQAFLFLGGLEGVREEPQVFERREPMTFWGAAVAPAGDVNGDGFYDFLVGGASGIQVFFGSAAIDTTAALILPIGAGAGERLPEGADLDGDGYADIVVGAPFEDGAQEREGSIILFMGGASGPALEASSVISPPVPEVDGGFGGWTETVGDLNGDGYIDLSVHANPNHNYLYFGGRGGVLERAGMDYVGLSALSTLGDVNGDGFADAVLDNQTVYLGTRTGLESSAVLEPGETLRCAALGDTNGDGFSDVAFNAPSIDMPVSNAGASQLFLGTTDGLVPSTQLGSPSMTAQARFSQSHSGAGDINGDGYFDYVASEQAPRAVHVFWGSPRGLGIVSTRIPAPELSYLFGTLR